MRHTVKPPTGKCHLIAHTRNEAEERPICLNCPYQRCVLDLRNRDPHPTDRSRGRPPNPLTAPRNARIIMLHLADHSITDLAARFNLTPASIYGITRSDRRRQLATQRDRRRQKEAARHPTRRFQTTSKPRPVTLAALI